MGNPGFPSSNIRRALHPVRNNVLLEFLTGITVGERIKGFLDDEFEIITYIATRNILKVTVNGVNFPDAIYKFGRTSIAHEGELDPRFQFDEGGMMAIGHVWNPPPTFIVGVHISVIVAPENRDEHISQSYRVTILDTGFAINDLWGAKESIRVLMEKDFGHPIFSEDA